MLGVGNTLGSPGASLSLDARVAIGAGVFAVSAPEGSAPEASVAVPEPRVAGTPAQKIPAYNAVEFSYRPDIGKVVLLEQNVETGQELAQVPTEYHLRQYAATQREQRVQLQQKLYKNSSGQSQAQTAPQSVPVSAAPKAAVLSAAPTASPPASPSVAPSTGATVAHVDIKA